MVISVMSLVADYGESEESNQDESSEESKSEEDLPPEEKSQKPNVSETKLPTPTLDKKRKLQNSVFTNPFLEAEKARNAVLETHVKMVPQGRDKEEKRVCWMFKKGNCRFGKQCRFVHTSVSPPELITSSQTPSPSSQSSVNQLKGTRTAEFTVDDEEPPKKKKRPGLTRGLVPNKKVLKMYKKQKNKK